ncbi:hypothetical protein F5Y02DRAFT_429235 [Annulohypoxylon stygium]|nr:hypothetical protein F5Y02DRAFT_429235 [Annulohypoxylon stygium]
MRLSIATLLTAGLGLATAAAIPPQENELDFFSFDNTTVTVEDTAKIPIKRIKCTEYKLAPFDVIAAREKLAHWGLTHKVPGKSMKKARSGNVVWYVCNCKWIHKDGLAMYELEEAEDALFNECGDYKSGWVWAKKWDKFYQVQDIDWVSKLPETWNWCPRKCAFDQVGVGEPDSHEPAALDAAANVTATEEVNATASAADATVEPTVDLTLNATSNATQS